MANLVITSTTNSIKVDFGGYYPNTIQFSKGVWKKDKILSITLDSCIEVNVIYEKVWKVSHDGAGNSFIIDSVDGIAPSSISDLYDKLIALIA